MLVAKYKFDKSVYENLIPVFNDGYNGYTVSDEIDSENSNHIIRTIECDVLPTLMRFGRVYVDGESATDNRTDSLLEILDMNTSGLTNCDSMFRYNKNLTSINCKWNTSNVTDMYGMFISCTNLTSLDVSNFNTSNVTNMRSMFNNCTNLTSLDVSNWDTSKVTNMIYMFRYCFNLTSLDVSNWDTSNVTDMQYMFYACQSLTSLDLSNWNTSKLTYLYTIFADCINLKSLNLSNWNVSNIKDLRYLISGCNKLKTLDISNWNFNSSISFTQNFGNNPLLTDIGMLYCSQSTINKVIPLITDGSKTIWVKDTKASDYTATDYVTIKDYKEDNRTLYLNSPLLEGDEIVNKEGKLYHYHKMGSVVLDGSKVLFTVVSESYQPTNTNFINFHYLNNNIKKRGEVYSNNFKYVFFGVSSDADTNCIWTHGSNNSIRLCIDKSKLKTTDENGLKQWFSENPTTIVYELAEPYYELISDDPLIVKSYAEGKLDTSSIITPTSIQFIPYEEELTYLYTSTQYCIQFNSTANCTVDITLGGTKVESKSVKIGLNKIYITTPSTLVDNKLIINAKGSATISEVVVVNSNAEFDYFDGLKSSFEDCLVTDVDNENYDKYEVGVKIVGKNKFKEYNEFIRIRKGQYYLLSSDITEGATRAYITMYDKDFNDITSDNYAKLNSVSTANGRYSLYFNTWRYITSADSEQLETRIRFSDNIRYIKIGWGWNSNSSEVQYNNVILEECEPTTSDPTSYEPYKETNATIYLNSPLLQGDRIEVKDGKLCHYHKMRKVVLDGSEDEGWVQGATNHSTGLIPSHATAGIKSVETGTGSQFSDRFKDGINYYTTEPGFYVQINDIAFMTQLTVVDFKQWIKSNPTTVVYELAEPYYEDITPIQSSFVISTVSEGDMEILTDLPIKSNITYLTNITSAVLMEQQLDELDNGTESLTNILEDEINE